MDDLGGALLVLRIDEGEEIADGDRLDVLLFELARGHAHGVLVERLEFFAVEAEAAADLMRHLLRHEADRLLPMRSR